MTEPAPQLNPDTGLLSLGDAAFGVLERLAGRGEDVTDETGLREQTALLRAASVLDSEGQLHSSLTTTIAVIRHAEAELVLTETGRRARMWVAGAHGALLLPVDDSNLRRLTYLPVWMLPETVSRVVGLGPRPRLPATEPDPLATLLAGDPRCHWTLARIPIAAGEGQEASLEVLDTAAGLWVVNPGVGDPMATPADPTTVWRVIIRMVRPSTTAAQTSQATI